MMTFLSGYGTYILAFIAGIGAFLINLGWISKENWDSLIAIIIPLALVTIRRAIANTKADVVAEVSDVKAQVATVDRKVANVVPAVTHAVVAEVTAVVQDAAPTFPHRPDSPHPLRS